MRWVTEMPPHAPSDTSWLSFILGSITNGVKVGLIPNEVN